MCFFSPKNLNLSFFRIIFLLSVCLTLNGLLSRAVSFLCDVFLAVPVKGLKHSFVQNLYSCHSYGYCTSGVLIT
uniref:Uncharacterized protein n=1 Tax=Anguilla anguilla TaxID=7936 RepID=A0A0E9WTF7_ANGAN